MLRTITPIAIALSALSAIPATAEAVPTARVVYADLDLTNPAGAKMLQHRVARAVTFVCGIPDAADLEALRLSNACRKQAVASSSVQVAAAIDKAVQVAQRGDAPQVASR